MPVSPASRAVVLVANAINIDLDLREIDISRDEHMTPEFLKVSKNIPYEPQICAVYAHIYV